MDLYRMTAKQMSDALARGEVASEALVAALQARADAVEPQVNGFTAQYREQALEQARHADRVRARGDSVGPLFGLPVTVKENLALVGTPSTLGVRARASTLATEDAGIVATLRAAGAVVLGKTNVPQLLLAMETTNDVFGTTNNPWDTARVPGGSSGGEAALLAAGASPAGVGTDIGGSIRNPAAYCGICGLKPTWSRWSVKGSSGGQPGQEAIRAQSGPMGRTVADLELLVQALSPAAQHAFDPAVPPLPWPALDSVDVSKLVVGVYEDDGVFQPAASVRRAVRLAADALRAAGATVVDYTPPRSWEMFDVYFQLLSADGFHTGLSVVGGEPMTQPLRTVARTGRLPSPVRRALATAIEVAGEPRVARLLRALGSKPVHRTWALVQRREALRRAELDAWAAQGLHAVLGPPTVTPAPLHGGTHDWSMGAWHTMRWNLLDLPAGVVPVTTVSADETVRATLADRLDRRAAEFEAGSAGLPVAVQVIARPWEEHLVMALMAAIERGRADATDTPRTPVDPVTGGAGRG